MCETPARFQFRMVDDIMKALTYRGHRDLAIENIPDPEIEEPGDAIIRIEKTAICGSDLHLYHAPAMPTTGFPLGHEFLGTIEDVGNDVRGFKPGQRVLVSCTLGCGHCGSCARQLYSGCMELTQMGPLSNILGTPVVPGGQAEGARIPYADTNLLPIPDGLSDEQLLFLTDILPTGYMGADLAEVGPGDVVVVYGCGPVGTFAQLSALIRGAACVVAVDLDDGRLAKARDRGCLPVNPQKEDLREVVMGLTDGQGADSAIEAVGKSELVNAALEIVRPGGCVSVVGVIVDGDVQLSMIATLLGKNLTLRSGAVNPQYYYPELLSLIRQGRLQPQEIITHRMSLDEGARGYEIFDAHEEDVLKVVLEP
jgi:threonine dehydrogenase-like Zn-dependent dehydrogenase